MQRDYKNKGYDFLTKKALLKKRFFPTIIVKSPAPYSLAQLDLVSVRTKEVGMF